MNIINIKYIGIAILPILFINTLSAQEAQFAWPDGKKAAISLSFDDARKSHITIGKDLFRKLEAKATFYVVPRWMQDNLKGWKEIVSDGHEIGNHTVYHPCTGNFSWAKENALENYSLTTMRSELLEANRQIEEMLGVVPISFAYTCGNTFVGRGGNTKSYAPLVNEIFQNGRGWLNESSNDPFFADLSLLQGVEMDGKDFEKDIKPMVDAAIENGNWLLLAGHEIGTDGRQTTRVKMLEELVKYLNEKSSDVWFAPVGPIAGYIESKRNEEAKILSKSMSFCASFDHGFDADYARGDRHIYGMNSSGKSGVGVRGQLPSEVGLSLERGKSGNALEFKRKSKSRVYFSSKDNLNNMEEDLSGSISFWLSLDPENDLAPGYTDPIQVTDSGFDDNAIWVDFSDKNPRIFRMGVFGKVGEWNPKKIKVDDNPDFIDRLVVAKDRPFRSDRWTHIVITYSKLSDILGQASLYINGQLQGARTIKESFSWEIDQSKIYLGINFIGLMDEISIFDRELSREEVFGLYLLPDGINTVLNVKRALDD